MKNKKIEITSNYIRGSVLVMFLMSGLLFLFSLFYWCGYFFCVSEEVFQASAISSVPMWLPVAATFLSGLLAGRASKKRKEDNKKNKFIPCDGKYDKNTFFTS